MEDRAPQRQKGDPDALAKAASSARGATVAPATALARSNKVKFDLSLQESVSGSRIKETPCQIASQFFHVAPQAESGAPIPVHNEALDCQTGDISWPSQCGHRALRRI